MMPFIRRTKLANLIRIVVGLEEGLVGTSDLGASDTAVSTLQKPINLRICVRCTFLNMCYTRIKYFERKENSTIQVVTTS